ncbi:MAG TPA: DUF998 domain-containing protein [Nitrospirota bacterium]|nr:DUF998 domain-containing protein [Nitrospirota bacterium]
MKLDDHDNQIAQSLLKRVMRLHVVLIISWLALLLAPVTMIVGHLGSHELNWTRDHISTYASYAPHSNWITASILLSAMSLACIGISFAKHCEFGRTPLGQITSMILGVSVSGLLLLVSFKETIPGGIILQNIDVDVIRQQALHDVGLFLFFTGSVVAAITAGLVVLMAKTTKIHKVGAIIATTGPLALVAKSHPWPKYLGIIGKASGLRQRAAFFCLWTGALLLLALLSRDEEMKEKCP